jgi:hypothetical protein
MSRTLFITPTLPKLILILFPPELLFANYTLGVKGGYSILRGAIQLRAYIKVRFEGDPVTVGFVPGVETVT